MGGMASSSSTSTPTMPKYVKGLYKDVYKDIGGAYNKFSKNGMPVFSEPTNAALTDQQTGALKNMTDVAAANSGGNGMSGQLQNIMSNGGFNGGQMDAMNSIKGLTNNGLMNELINSKNGLTGEQDKAYQSLQNTVYGNNQQFQNTFNNGGFDARQAAAYGGLNDTVNRNNAVMDQTLMNGGLSGDQNLVAQRYRDMMSSPIDINANPAYAQVKQNALNAGAQSVTGQAAKMGRLGGGANQNILSRNQMETSANMDLGEYRNEQGRRDAGANSLANIGQTGVGNQMGINQAQQQGYQNLGTFGQIGQGNQLAVNSAQQQGLNNIASMGNMGVGQNSNAIGQKAGLEAQLFNMNQAGLGNMGQAYDTALKPSQTQMGAGNILQQQAQNTINDKMRMFDAQNPMNAYTQFLQLAGGMPTGTTQTTNPSTLQMLLGGGIGGLGLLGGLGMFGSSAPAAGGTAV